MILRLAIIATILATIAACQDKSPEYIKKLRELHGQCNAKCEVLKLKGYLDFDGYCQCEDKK